MSTTWYPMINYENCIECGACIDHCTHGVYKKDEAPKPIVIYPDNCVQGCTGCAKECLVEAITYFGQNEKVSESSCCSGDSGCNCGDEQEEKAESGCGCEGGCCG